MSNKLQSSISSWHLPSRSLPLRRLRHPGHLVELVDQPVGEGGAGAHREVERGGLGRAVAGVENERNTAWLIKEGRQQKAVIVRVRKQVGANTVMLADAIRASVCPAPARQSLSERRLQDVLRFIQVHLSDPKLSTMMVAEASLTSGAPWS